MLRLHIEEHGTAAGGRLFRTARGWPLPVWERHYASHPVTGAITRQLIWELETPSGEPISAVPGPDGLTGADGQPLRQPFRQASREVYRLTSAEAEKVLAPCMLCRGTTDLIGAVVSVWRPVTFPLPPRPPPGRSMRRRYRR
jgi:hypothetical protein